VLNFEAGRDAYVLSQLVGQGGYVVGVDNGDTQITVARNLAEWHRVRFGYSRSNVRFVQGCAEQLLELGDEMDEEDGAEGQGAHTDATCGGSGREAGGEEDMAVDAVPQLMSFEVAGEEEGER
jgi:hypothetical protein